MNVGIGTSSPSFRLDITPDSRVLSYVRDIEAMADELEKQDPRIALALDRVCDWLERRSWGPTVWLPGRDSRNGGGYLDWASKPQEGPSREVGMCVCPKCKQRARSKGNVVSCPQCGSKMARLY
jgi:ssDNA-binding Zn-finger/Zn-ribbon topoisomerase 1